MQDGEIDTARVLFYLCHKEYKSILAGREGLRLGVYLPDYTVTEVYSQVGRDHSLRLHCFNICPYCS